VTSSTAPVPGQQARIPTRDESRERLGGLLRGARAGHRDDLDRIVAELTPLLWHVARSQGLDPAACEDVVQTTWLRLLAQLDRIHDPEALTAWLVTVARREARRVFALGSREQPVAVEALESRPDARQRPDDALVEGERRAVLWRAIGRLPKRCQELLKLIAYVNRPDYDAVAVALGMPRGSIGPTRGRCLAKLRILLLSQPDWSWP
jgi:RNA polymerase sigma factor (sigma-70 family)